MKTINGRMYMSAMVDTTEGIPVVVSLENGVDPEGVKALKLLNAAPELLAALKAAAMRLDEAAMLLGIKPESQWFRDYANESRAAIEKAEGGEG